MTRLNLWIAVVSLALTVPAVQADKEKAPVSAQTALARLKAGNARFAADKSEGRDVGPKKRAQLAEGQAPFAAVLACADSRVAPELIFDQGLGDLFVVRVAGNVAEPGLVGSLE
jgi:carbonic anhydrase